MSSEPLTFEPMSVTVDRVKNLCRLALADDTKSFRDALDGMSKSELRWTLCFLVGCSARLLVGES